MKNKFSRVKKFEVLIKKKGSFNKKLLFFIKKLNFFSLEQ
jgi:hypothetical protein